jgi:hypothetical protein
MNSAIEVTWKELKENIIAKEMRNRLQWLIRTDPEDSSKKYYQVFLIDEEFILSTKIPLTEPKNGIQYDFETNFKKSNKKLSPQYSDSTGVERVSVEKPDMPSTTLISHDWCDACTWYMNSVRVENEVLELETGKLYNSSKQKWIDTSHGRITDEDDIHNNYKPYVYDGAQELLEDRDYTINYEDGKVTISDSYALQGSLTATYSYATTSNFLLEPKPGKILILEHAELNFSKSCLINVPINFEIWAGNPFFDPKNPISEINPLRFLYKRKKYKNEKDIINAANLGQGFIPQWGNLPDDTIIFPFNYITLQPLRSSQYAQLILSLSPNSDGEVVPLTGSWGTVSFYIISLVDPDWKG